MAVVSAEEALEALFHRQLLCESPLIRCPTLLLQRHFRLGYAATVALFSDLEKRGLVRRISGNAIELTGKQIDRPR